MSTKGSISIAFVREALRAVQSRGIEVRPLLASAQIRGELLECDDARVTPAAFGALWLAIAVVLDDEFFGLDSRRMKTGSFAILCHFAIGAPTLREALRRMLAFFRTVLDDTSAELRAEGADAAVIVTSKPLADAAEIGRLVFAHETLLVMLHGMMCWLIARRIPIRRAQFAYPQPAWWSEYNLVFSNLLAFDAPDTRVVFSERTLDAPVVQSSESALAFLRGAPANFILKYRDDQSLAARIRRRLRALPPAAWPSFAQAAAELGLGASTLHRKLAQEGTTFRAIAENVRRDLAVRFLADSPMSVVDIAESVGFAEPSAFRRAFKQWTGSTPGAYRSSIK
jgi:AraC-like DNA-binding protein